MSIEVAPLLGVDARELNVVSDGRADKGVGANCGGWQLAPRAGAGVFGCSPVGCGWGFDGGTCGCWSNRLTAWNVNCHELHVSKSVEV